MVLAPDAFHGGSQQGYFKRETILVSALIMKDAVLETMRATMAFALGSSAVNQGVIPTVQTIAKVMKTYDKPTIEVTGHADAAGSVAERQVLSKQRVEVERELFLLPVGYRPPWLQTQGMPKANIWTALWRWFSL
jgi:outer membrane protein OmpA-like peptidoglycan-associated protein